jgi:hypothetical protein
MIIAISEGFRNPMARFAQLQAAQNPPPVRQTAIQRMTSLIKHGFPRRDLSVQNDTLFLELHEPDSYYHGGQRIAL